MKKRHPRFSSMVLQIAILMLYMLTNTSGFAAQADIPLPVSAKMPFAQTGFKALSPASEAIWQQHLQTVHKSPLQAACEPFRLQAKGEHRGSILLLHGFTACPQQYWDIAPKLAAAGFDVLVPLLPGHGRPYGQLNNKILDDLSAMPVDQDYVVYQDFGVKMSEMLRQETGRKMLIGLSLGGVISATALERMPGFYDRALLLGPLFDVVKPSNLYVAPVNVFLPRSLADWGPGCESERAAGRGGYCQFTPAQVRAVQLVGLQALENIANVVTTVQIAGVENDGAADNDSIAQAVRRLPFGHGCLYRKGANHSMLSVYDAPKEDKFWLPSLHRQLLRFVISDEFFDTDPGVEVGLPRCRIP